MRKMTNYQWHYSPNMMQQCPPMQRPPSFSHMQQQSCHPMVRLHENIPPPHQQQRAQLHFYHQQYPHYPQNSNCQQNFIPSMQNFNNFPPRQHQQFFQPPRPSMPQSFQQPTPPMVMIPQQVQNVIEEEPLDIKTPLASLSLDDLDFSLNLNNNEEVDIYDYLMLGFGEDEPQDNSRKRRISENQQSGEPKRIRRSRAQIIADRNQKLLEQCSELSIVCNKLDDISNHVRIYGNYELRERTIRMPRMKLAPTNEEFHKIKNIGYLRTSNGIAYGCFIDSCRYKSYDKEKFENHLTTFHHIDGAGSRQGYCLICDSNSCGFCLKDELDHMQSHHINVPYRATKLILYSKINNKLGKKKKNSQLKITIKVPEKPAEQDIDEVISGLEVVDDGKDDDYRPETEIETEDEESVSESDSVASSDMESEELEGEMTLDDKSSCEEELPPLDDKSSDEETMFNRRKRNNISKLLSESQNSLSSSCDDDEELIDKIPQYMLQRIKINLSLNETDEDKKEIPLSRENLIKDILEIDQSTEKSLKKCSVRLTRLENNSLSKFMNPTSNKEPTKSVVLNIPTPPASEDSRDSMSSPRDDNKQPKVVLKLKFPSKTQSQPQEQKTTKSLRNRAKSISDSRVAPLPLKRSRRRSLFMSPSSESKCEEIFKMIHDLRKNREKNNEERIKEQENVEPNSENFTQNQNEFENILNIEESLPSINNFIPSSQISEPNSELLKNCDVVNEEIILSSQSSVFTEPITISSSQSSVVNIPSSLESNQDDELFKESQTISEENQALINFNEQVDQMNLSVNDLPDKPSETEKEISSDKIDKKFSDENSPQNSQTKTSAEDSETIEVLCSQEEMQDLSDVQHLFPWIDSSHSSKILKSKRCIEILQNENCLFSTYKCMKENCGFFTTCHKKFKTHAEKHDGLHHFCSFCLFDAVSGNELSDHLESHKFDRYQCNFCMYRSREKLYVVWHAKRYHMDQKLHIYLSPTQKLLKSEFMRAKKKVEEENWEKFVLPYTCTTQFCNKKFFSKQNYFNHLKEESNRPSIQGEKVTNVCNQIFAIDHRHPSNRNKIMREGKFQCLYCLFGADIIDDIYKHLTDLHAHELGFYCQRGSNLTEKNETRELQTKIIELQQDKTIKVKFFPKEKTTDLLNTPDYLPSLHVVEKKEEIIQLDENSSSSYYSVENEDNGKNPNKSIPGVSEVLQIDNC